MREPLVPELCLSLCKGLRKGCGNKQGKARGVGAKKAKGWGAGPLDTMHPIKESETLESAWLFVANRNKGNANGT